MIVWISLILVFIGYSSKWCMDTLIFHYDKSIFKTFNNQDYWNPILSWDNKYVRESRFLVWIFKNPLVWTTDAWHLFQFFYLNSLIFVISLLLSTIIDLQILLSFIIKPMMDYQLLIFIISFLIIRLVYSITGLIFYK